MRRQPGAARHLVALGFHTGLTGAGLSGLSRCNSLQCAGKESQGGVPPPSHRARGRGPAGACVAQGSWSQRCARLHDTAGLAGRSAAQGAEQQRRNPLDGWAGPRLHAGQSPCRRSDDLLELVGGAEQVVPPRRDRPTVTNAKTQLSRESSRPPFCSWYFRWTGLVVAYGSAVSPTMRAPGAAMTPSASRTKRASADPPSSPRLLPNMRKVSKGSGRDAASSNTDPVKVVGTPRSRHTAVAPGEMSRATTSWPRSCKATLALPAPAPMSSTRPRASSKAESGSVEKYLAASVTARKPSDRSISSYATPEAPPACWQARRTSPNASPIASYSSWTRTFSIRRRWPPAAGGGKRIRNAQPASEPWNAGLDPRLPADDAPPRSSLGGSGAGREGPESGLPRGACGLDGASPE